MRTRILLAVMGIVTGLVVAGGIVGVTLVGDRDLPPGLLADPWPAPPLHLERPDGTPASLDDVPGSYVAVFFGYTHCPDVCPITLAHLAREKARLDPDGTELGLVFVTVDPVRDTPERLMAWTGAFQVPVWSLTGTVDAVRDAAWAWGIGVQYRDPETNTVVPDPPARDDYLVDHTARTFLVDPEGRVVAQLAPDLDGGELRRLLEELLR